MKEIALGKRTKISQAQQYMILAVFGASIFLGAAIAVVINSITKISFNADVIIKQDQSIVGFSDAIKNIGICEQPSGSVYTEAELERCDPNDTDAASVPGTLRANILEVMAQNPALNSTPNKNIQACVKPDSGGKNYTYKELEAIYKSATDEESKMAATNLIKSCSALRIIPDALPAIANTESLLATVNQIFLETGTEPMTLSPKEVDDGATEEESAGNMASFGTNLYPIGASFALENNINTIAKLLVNSERSIRNFNFKTISMEWKDEGNIEFSGVANAYYMGKSAFGITNNSIKPGGK